MPVLEVEAVTPGEWMEFDFDLQPTIYKLEKGATLRLVLYTTDFEITVRDQTDYQLTIDLAQSSLHLPEMTRWPASLNGNSVKLSSIW